MDSLGETLSLITTTLEGLRIPDFVGGSVASSIRGVWRTTLDVDLIASVGAQQATALVGALGPEWYADPAEIQRSIELGRAFNLIYIKNATKVDIFPACDEFHASQLRRATVVRVGSAQIPCRVATAEDSPSAISSTGLRGSVSQACLRRSKLLRRASPCRPSRRRRGTSTSRGRCRW